MSIKHMFSWRNKKNMWFWMKKAPYLELCNEASRSPAWQINSQIISYEFEDAAIIYL